ncbi:MAG: type IV pili twitching motility protein PilT [Candidatus Wallbacteria bacterium HGW-Wallbacteria-1]|jgi:twitching motility protein PilT|uniref:Type IV pili twitching motility protein PilT n=1 Tax=Candidatus Wallbacteria bacterium HGW-Wallbacteria-1 TaxID=2013854 RepID=A0A2N1PTT8_9BACT|nr:MAG: type IV pili twitching motility protein PilT [Candidatus Wallbacteria bacterium HGW-Wallbacteria-1]
MFVLNDLLNLVVDNEASDLHITVGTPPVIRVDGDLVSTDLDVLTPMDTRSLIYNMLTAEQQKQFEELLELDISYSVHGFGRFRVNIYKQRGCLGAAFRVIPSKIPALNELGLPQKIKDFSRLPKGLVLITGPTGSGKSTTLAALTDQVNREQRNHIITVEDPIEYLHYHKKSIVNQRELHVDTYSFGEALKRILRQDPDVVLIGEMRDLETVSAALTLAETGHLVYGTLHTTDCAQTINRIIDIFPPFQQQQIRTQLSFVLQGVVAQQLLPLASGKGRAPAIEIMLQTPAVQNLVREQKIHQLYTVMQTSTNIGMQTFEQSLKDLYMRGDISLSEAMSRTLFPEELQRMIKSST